MCGSYFFEYFFKLHILKCKGHQKMGTTRISEKKVKSLLLPKDATNFSMRFAFVGNILSLFLRMSIPRYTQQLASLLNPANKIFVANPLYFVKNVVGRVNQRCQ
jgi:hypothetical protein